MSTGCLSRLRQLGGQGRGMGGRARQVGWGVLDQGLSSATNFGLTILAGRLLGPRGLGEVMVAFSVYLLALTLQRALVNEPLVVVSTGLEAGPRREAARSALTVVVLGGALVTLIVAAVASLLPPTAARGVGLIVPWLVAGLLQDLWRSILFRDRRGAAAALNDGVWVLGILLALPVVVGTRESWTVLGAWGFGAALAAVVGFVQTRFTPERLGRAWRWWRDEAWSFGRWLGLESVVLSAQSQATVFMLASILGIAGLGAIRAAEAVFAPMSLLGPALELPGLPVVSRALAHSVRAARRRALQLSATAFVLVAGYVAVAVALRSQVLTVVFGPAFAQFQNLVFPIGIAQLVYAAAIGSLLLLKATRRGRDLLVGRLLASVSSLILVGYLGWRYGVLGASWGLAIGAGSGWVVVMLLARRDVDAPEGAGRAPDMERRVDGGPR